MLPTGPLRSCESPPQVFKAVDLDGEEEPVVIQRSLQVI